MQKIIITGATGFLGQHLVSQLKDKYKVLALGRNKLIGENLGVDFLQIDLSEVEKLKYCFKGFDYIIHCAALSSLWGKREDFIKINVKGTENIIKAGEYNNIQKIIYISSPSIYFDGSDKFNLTENSALPKKQINFYAESKVIAEQLIQKSYINSIILRPRGIFGEGDNSILPRLIKAYQKNQLYIIGDGNNYVDLTYIENVVESIVLALKAEEYLNKKVYNITNDEPVLLWKLIEQLLNKIDYSFNTKKKISYNLAYLIAWYKELIAKEEPTFTRYSVGLLAKSQTFDITLAKHELGYKPKINMEAGINRLANWWKNKND